MATLLPLNAETINYRHLVMEHHDRGSAYEEIEYGIVYPNGDIQWSSPGTPLSQRLAEFQDAQVHFNRNCDNISAARQELKLVERRHRHSFGALKEIDTNSSERV